MDLSHKSDSRIWQLSQCIKNIYLAVVQNFSVPMAMTAWNSVLFFTSEFLKFKVNFFKLKQNLLIGWFVVLWWGIIELRDYYVIRYNFNPEYSILKFSIKIWSMHCFYRPHKPHPHKPHPYKPCPHKPRPHKPCQRGALIEHSNRSEISLINAWTFDIFVYQQKPQFLIPVIK